MATGMFEVKIDEGAITGMVKRALQETLQVPGPLAPELLQAMDDRTGGGFGFSSNPVAFSDARLLQILTYAACPVVCIGHRDPGGEDWHQVCENKAARALAILRGHDV